MNKSIYTDEYKIFSNLLKEYREKKSILQGQLAQKLETNQTQISRYEKGQVRLDFVQINHYLKAMDVSLQEFIEEYLNRISNINRN